MKNVQVIDCARNCTFSIFQATDEEFLLVFPEAGQDIQYAEDLGEIPHQEEIFRALYAVWERPIRKQDVHGIHGALSYELEHYKRWYPEKREDAVVEWAINGAQRKLFGSKPASSRRSD
jgi:hypothetical protein